MTHTQFPIGFWNILSATQLGPEAVADWKDFGTTLTMTGTYDPGQDKQAFLAVLDECAKQHIQLLVSDRRLGYDLSADEAQYRENVRQVTADFAWHPAVCGFHLGDEPGAAQTENAIRAVRIFREICPDKLPFLNLLPWYSDEFGGVEARVAARADYKDYLIDFVRRSGIPILSYDCYFQLEEEHGQPTARAWETYYRNLRIFKEAAAETGVELWYTTLAVGHMMYRCPTRDDLRWEINTAVAHGVKALFYWFLYSGFYNANYRYAPINELFERTETFDWLSTENRLFARVFGQVFTRLQLEQVSHVGKAYGGFPLFDEDSDRHIARVCNKNGVPMILSRFSCAERPGYAFYAVVDNSVTDSTCTGIVFREPTEVYEVRSTETDMQLIPLGLQTEIAYWFSPGQMWVIAVKETEEVGAKAKS